MTTETKVSITNESEIRLAMSIGRSGHPYFYDGSYWHIKEWTPNELVNDLNAGYEFTLTPVIT